MRTLICDLNVYDEGHHIAYVNSILAHTAGQEDILFLYNRKAADWCPALSRDKRVFWVEEDLLHKSHQNLMLGKFREYGIIRGFAVSNKVDRLVLLDIDQYQLAIGMMPAPFRVTGIYFRSFHNVRIASDSWFRSMKNAAYYLKKRLMFQVLRMNRMAEPLYLLNDRLAAIRHPARFAYLPDPVFTGQSLVLPPPLAKTMLVPQEESVLPLQQGWAEDEGLGPGAGPGADPGADPGAGTEVRLRELYGIPAGAHTFLVFGAMGARKNITNIIAAYKTASLAGPTVLWIAGKVRTDYKQEFYHAVNGFRETNQDADKNLIVVDKFIDEDLIDAYFRESDTILLCYQKFYGSSGLMGKAALHEKTCIVPHEGLLNDLCREYNLGYASDPLDIAGMASAMNRARHEPVRSSGRRQFVQEHSEPAFISTLLH
jgi:hypothetical protein